MRGQNRQGQIAAQIAAATQALPIRNDPPQNQAQPPAPAAQQQARNEIDANAIAIAGLQRFLEMAAEDREDEWDSDEMEGEDDTWAIPDAPIRQARDVDAAIMGAEGRPRMGFLVGRR